MNKMANEDNKDNLFPLSGYISDFVSEFCSNNINDAEFVKRIDTTVKENVSHEIFGDYLSAKYDIETNKKGKLLKSVNLNEKKCSFKKTLGLYDLEDINIDFLSSDYGNIIDPGSKKLNGIQMDSKEKENYPYVLIVETYSSIIHSKEEQPIYIVLLNKRLPESSIIATIVFCTEVERTTLSVCFLNKKRSENHSIQFQMSTSVFEDNRLLSSLPILIIQQPFRNRIEPKLCYSINKNSTYKRTTPASKYMNCVSLNQLSITNPKSTMFCSKGKSSSLKFKNHIGIMNNFCHHIRTEFGAFNINNSLFREVKLFYATLNDGYANSIIPFELRVYIYLSAPMVNRRGISIYHQRLFEVAPFRIVSAHIFTKMGPNDKYAIFAFTLTPTYDMNLNQSCKDEIPTRYVASLDRFEASDRNCSDPRFWSYVDSVICKKNIFAATYFINEWNPYTLSSPIPPLILKKICHQPNNMVEQKKKYIEIAPDIQLHWEVWPSSYLPVFKEKEVYNKDNLACKDGESPTDANLSKENKKEEESENEIYFGFTLCVGEYIFTSTTGIGTNVLKFIVNEWLKWV